MADAPTPAWVGVGMWAQVHDSRSLQELLPYSPDWRPVPSLRIAGGLSMWGFQVWYRWGRHYIELEARFACPCSRDDGAPIRHVVATAQIDLHHPPHYARMVFTKFVRDAAIHEVDESIWLDEQLLHDPHAGDEG